MLLGSAYLLACMLKKRVRQGRSSALIILGLIIAALGLLIVASSARNRELQTPWYAQRSASIRFASSASAADAYKALTREFNEGMVNGYAFVTNVDTSGGITLGGQEGDLWNPVSAEDAVYSTADDVFWIHQQAVPERFIHNLGALTASVNGVKLSCAGLSYHGLRWDFDDTSDYGSDIEFLLNGKRPMVEPPFLDNARYNGEWFLIAPVIVSAEWMAINDIPIDGICLTLAEPNDANTLGRISSGLNAPHSVDANWGAGKIGALTANEWVYLGALILAMLNVASLFYGLIDGYQYELMLYRKMGASRGSVYFAFAAIILVISSLAFIIAGGLYGIMFASQGARQWLAPLSAEYMGGLFAGFTGLCLTASLLHARRMLKKFRLTAANL